MSKTPKIVHDLDEGYEPYVVPAREVENDVRVKDHIALAWANFDAKATHYRTLANGFEDDFGRENLMAAVVPCLERKLSRLHNEVVKTQQQLLHLRNAYGK